MVQLGKKSFNPGNFARIYEDMMYYITNANK